MIQHTVQFAKAIRIGLDVFDITGPFTSDTEAHAWVGSFAKGCAFPLPDYTIVPIFNPWSKI